MAEYLPQPLDTSRIQLPPDLQVLLERLAENTHEVWAAQRWTEGWRPGPRRDDDLKQHPCLAPYAELPESEREYDRQTAAQALKFVLALGYRIER